MATTPEIKTKFTLDGMRQAATGLRAFGRTVADTLGEARQRGGTVFAPLDRGLRGVETRAKSASKAMLAIGGKGAFGGIKLGAIGASAAVGGLTAKMTALSAATLKAAKDSAASLKAISIDAQRIGGSTSDVAVLGYAADLTGTDRDELVTQIATISNEFLTLRENIFKAQGQYGDFLSMTAQEAALAKRLGNQAGVQSIIGGFAAADLEARKASITDIEARIAQIDGSLNKIYVRGDRRGGTYGDAARLQLVKERQQLQQAADEFRNSQSPQAQALFELQKYGIDIDRASRGGVEGLLEISDAFRKIENPSQRARVAMRLFGEDAGVKLIPLLNGGREAIDEYRRTLEKSGTIATREDIENAEAYTRSMQNLRTASDGVKLTIGRELTPELTVASDQLTNWIIKSREEIAKFAVDAFKGTKVFSEDVVRLIGGDTGNVETPWLDSLVKKSLVLAEIWEDVKTQVRLLWKGEDSDYEWLNTLRDAFVQVKAFAIDAWSVISGGTAIRFDWMNTLRDQVVAFMVRLGDAFGMVKDLVASIGEMFKPLFDWLGKDIATVGLFIGLLRMLGLFGALTTASGLLFKSLGAVFSLAGGAASLVGAAGAAAGAAGGAAGAAGTAAATAGGLRLAIAGVTTAIGGLASAALILGTTLAGAFALGQKAAQWMMKDTLEGYEKLWAAQSELTRAQAEPYLNGLMNDRTDRTIKFRGREWAKRGVIIDDRTADEKYVDGKQDMDMKIWGEKRFEGENAAEQYREFYKTQRELQDRAQAAYERSAAAKRVQVDLNVAGRTTTLEGDEVSVMQLTRTLEQANRGY